eukprot:NODE_567_length_5957_cov_0.651588.p2 type:complete len:303 gc:universal NODE_567_length_5957_cov_0.651588:4889-3981(-)
MTKDEIKESTAERKQVDINAYLENTPLFMTELPENMSDHVELEAIQSLVYEGNPEEIAMNFKQKGNEQYTLKRYKEAIQYYKRGLEQTVGKELEIVLKLNLAQSHLMLSNFRSCYLICIDVLKMDRMQVKAYFKAVNSLFKCEKYEECLELINVANHYFKDEYFDKIKKNCIKQRILRERKQMNADKMIKLQNEKFDKIYQILDELKIKVVGELANAQYIPVLDESFCVPVIVKINSESILFEKVDVYAHISGLLEMAQINERVRVEIDAQGHLMPIASDLTVLEVLQKSCLIGGCLLLTCD